MVASPLQLPKRPVITRRRPQNPPEVRQSSGLVKWISELVVASVKIGVYVPIAAMIVTFLVAFIQRICFPQCVAVVQEFEVSPEVAKRISLSGKAASNTLIDILNQHASDGARFHGAEYYAYDAAGAQSIALDQSMKVPVQSSYGIEVKGISVDSIIKVYNRIRNHEWSIGGDITGAGDQIVMTLRVNQGDVAKSWQVKESGQGDGGVLIRRATEAMLADQNPELLGRSFLQEHKYDRAIETFRKWTLNDPRDWKPSYYLSLAYDYQGRPQDALTIARWSRDIAEHEKKMSEMIAKKPASLNTATPSELAEVTEAVSWMNAVPKTELIPKPDASKYLFHLNQAEILLADLTKKSPKNANYTIQLARVLDREADLQSNLQQNFAAAIKNDDRAIGLLNKAIERAPENGGLYEQRSMFLSRLSALAPYQHDKPIDIADLQYQMTDGFKLALELNPTNSSPLWAAVYGLLARHQNQDAMDLARTIMLLQPDCTTAEVAYIVALAVSGHSNEANQLLPAVLEKADQSELQALWNNFQSAGNSEGLKLIGETGKKRLNQDFGLPS